MARVRVRINLKYHKIYNLRRQLYYLSKHAVSLYILPKPCPFCHSHGRKS